MANYFRIRAKHSGKVLTVNGSYSNRTPVAQCDDTGSDKQLFRFHKNKHNNGYQIIPKGNNNFSFSIDGVNPTPGTELMLTEFDSYEKAKRQTFYFIDNGYGYQMINVRYDYSDITGSAVTSLSTFYSLESSAQDHLVYDQNKDKSSYIKGLVLDVPRGAHDEGLQIIQWSKHGSDNQLFAIEPA